MIWHGASQKQVFETKNKTTWTLLGWQVTEVKRL